MKTIKIKFCDWYTGFNEEDNWLTNLLRKDYNIEFSDEPDYVFFSVWGNSHLNYDCIKIFYTAEDISPDFNLCDYAIGFDNMVFEDRYIRFSLFMNQKEFPVAAKKHIYTETDLKEKTGFCDYVVSNGNGDPIRTEIFHRLSEYKKVDSGGRYLNNIGGPIESKFEFQKKHKFSITFENGAQRGYTTEKIVHAFAAKTIPIYWGNPDIASDFNTKSFINYRDYGNLDDLIKRVIEVDNDDELYRSILSEPIFEDGEIPEKFRMETLEKFLCHIIEQPLSEAGRRCFHTWRRVYIADSQYNKKIIDNSRKLLPRIAYKLTK